MEVSCSSKCYPKKIYRGAWANNGGNSYFKSWFHCFDGLVILVSVITDLLAQGIIEEIASLVIVLRLWRFVKIVEELSVGASETMEDIQTRAEQLEKENEELRSEVRALRGDGEV